MDQFHLVNITTATDSFIRCSDCQYVGNYRITRIVFVNVHTDTKRSTGTSSSKLICIRVHGSHTQHRRPTCEEN